MLRESDSSKMGAVLKMKYMLQPKPLQMPIYMDHNATTPLDPHVVQAMRPFFEAEFGNASSSSHAYGWQAQAAVKKAREQVAKLVACRAGDVIWTSGATESNNLALLGVVREYCKPGSAGERPHIITQATEHKAVLEVIEAAEDWGAECTVLGVDSLGFVRVEDIRRAMKPSTIMVSIMMANNEIGALQPVEEIGGLCKERGVIFHTDAAQSVCKIPVDLQKLSVDMMSMSGHKIYGPKGVGCLIVRKINREFEIKSILFGGEQERGLRPGTLNVPGIVGFGAACEIAAAEMESECERLQEFQRRILRRVMDRFPQVKLNGPVENRLCNNVSFSFPDMPADDLALGLSGVAYSAGSACNSASPKPSHVLKAMGLSDALARSTLRLGMGRFTTAEEVDAVTDKLVKLLGKAYGQVV
jgi:cysteine desulfurase